MSRARSTRARFVLARVAHRDRDRLESPTADLGVSQATWTTLQRVAGGECCRALTDGGGDRE